ncbi:MAG: InlB B-repeat-containing protein, partial [Oscillospiraceae bacterium]|nr:InlB B-repeat-containing protein [Oscillospiraceae bacterium]
MPKFDLYLFEGRKDGVIMLQKKLAHPPAKPKILRRMLSVLLALAMVLPGMALLGGIEVGASLAVVEAAQITFTAPETVWMYGNNTGTILAFGSLGSTGSQSTGSVAFTSDKATSEYKVEGFLGASATAFASSTSASYSITNNFGSITYGSPQVITWKATYKYAGDTTEYHSYTYTVAYAPSIKVIGVTQKASGYHAGSAKTIYNQSGLVVMGLDTAWTGGAYGPNATLISNLYSGTSSWNNQAITGAALASGNTIRYSDIGNNCDYWTYDHSDSRITVDTSRFADIVNVPGYKFALIKTDDENSQQSKREAWISSGTAFAGTSLGYYDHGSAQSEGVFYSSVASFNLGANSSGQAIIRYDGYTESRGTSGTDAHWCLENNNMNSHGNNNRTFVCVYVDKVNKSTLKTNVNTRETTKRVPDENASNASDFNSKLKAAVTALGTPNATQTTVDAVVAVPALTAKSTGTATNNHINLATGATVATETKVYNYGEAVTGSVWCTSGTNGAGATVNSTNYVYSYHKTPANVQVNTPTESSVVNPATATSYTWNFYYYPIYYISYNTNGGTPATIAKTSGITYNTTATTALPTAPTRTGYTFGGWTVANATNGVSSIAASATTVKNDLSNVPGTVELTAVWTVNSYTWTFKNNYTSTDNTNNSVKTQNYDTALSVTNPSRTGYTFGAWYAEAACTTLVTVPAKMPAYGNTVYAKWTPIPYTVTYNGNNATSGATGNSSHTYDVDKNLTTNGFARDGYTFGGWAESATGGAVYTNSESVKNLTTVNGATVELFAVWTINSFTWIFKNNYGGSDTTDHYS